MFVRKETIRQIISVLTGMNARIHDLEDKIGTLRFRMAGAEAEDVCNAQRSIDLANKINLCLDRLDILEKKKAKKVKIKTTTKTKRK